MHQIVVQLPHFLSKALLNAAGVLFSHQVFLTLFLFFFPSFLQAATITACSATVPAAADGASSPTPPCRASVCWTVAGTTSWMPPRKSANVRENKRTIHHREVCAKFRLTNWSPELNRPGMGKLFGLVSHSWFLKFDRGAYTYV